jgi:hypothetical protein
MTIPINTKVLNEILEKTNISTGMYTQKVYKETLRSLIGLFGNIYYVDRNNQPIKIRCFHGNQERAIAKSTTGDNITLPVITIVEKSSENDEKRNKYKPILIHETYWDKDKQRAVRILSMSPRAINISYDINIWTKYKEDMDQIRESIFILFNPDYEIKTKYSDITKAFIRSETDIKNPEADDGDDRILQKSITIKVETYIPNPKFLYTSTGRIETFNYEIDVTEE